MVWNTKKKFLLFCFSLQAISLFAQQPLIIEQTLVNNTIPGYWSGVVIQKNAPKALVYKSNYIASINSSGYMLQAGDEMDGLTKNFLDGALIKGNKLTWDGKDVRSITHGIFTGYNINVNIRYNYLDKVPMGIIRKSNGMYNTSGGIAYNIIKNPLVGVVAKGMNGVCIYNNTFYSNKTVQEAWRGLIEIYSNDLPVASSTGTKIKNNIFYTSNMIFNISLEDISCIEGFESDYNVFWCENGTPKFNYLGVSKTFAQWQELGYDLHSVVVNPHFLDMVNFIPRDRLDYGTNLGTEWISGLSVDARWEFSEPATADQNGKWQVGARIHSFYSGKTHQSGSGMLIYPNPVHNGKLHITLKDNLLEPVDLSILDISGKLLLRRQFGQINYLTLDLSGYPPAQYVMLVSSDKFRYSDTFIIK